MTKSEAKKLHCTVEAAIAVIGGKYKAIIVWWLNEKGVTARHHEEKKGRPGAEVLPSCFGRGAQGVFPIHVFIYLDE